MPKKVFVIATPSKDPALKGLARVTKEGTRGRYILEDKAEEVELSAYYMRRIARGELQMVDKPTEAKEPSKRRTKKVAEKRNPLDNADRSGG